MDAKTKTARIPKTVWGFVIQKNRDDGSWEDVSTKPSYSRAAPLSRELEIVSKLPHRTVQRHIPNPDYYDPILKDTGLWVIVDEINCSALWDEEKNCYCLVDNKFDGEGYLILPAVEWNYYPDLDAVLDAMRLRSPLSNWKEIK